jgi:hypothetical protein
MPEWIEPAANPVRLERLIGLLPLLRSGKCDGRKLSAIAREDAWLMSDFDDSLGARFPNYYGKTSFPENAGFRFFRSLLNAIVRRGDLADEHIRSGLAARVVEEIAALDNERGWSEPGAARCARCGSPNGLAVVYRALTEEESARPHARRPARGIRDAGGPPGRTWACYDCPEYG